jgi:hypothetical protein
VLHPRQMKSNNSLLQLVPKRSANAPSITDTSDTLYEARELLEAFKQRLRMSAPLRRRDIYRMADTIYGRVSLAEFEVRRANGREPRSSLPPGFSGRDAPFEQSNEHDKLTIAALKKELRRLEQTTPLLNADNRYQVYVKHLQADAIRRHLVDGFGL